MEKISGEHLGKLERRFKNVDVPADTGQLYLDATDASASYREYQTTGEFADRGFEIRRSDPSMSSFFP